MSSPTPTSSVSAPTTTSPAPPCTPCQVSPSFTPRIWSTGISSATPSIASISAPTSASKTARTSTAEASGAPSFRYHNGTFYIFANINRFGLQVYRATDPRGPWTHNRIEQGLHDLSVLFDDDGKIYAVYGASTIHIVELTQDLTALVPGTDRVLIERSQGMGEGSHIYKLKGKYYIVSAIPGAHVPMKCARADTLAGPWEVTTISANESLGIGQGYRPKQNRTNTPPYEINPPDLAENHDLDLHQGGIVDTPSGEWWGWSMQDHNSVGRLTSLSPVTWKDGWPYFGLPGNLTRTPSIWVKPNTGYKGPVTSPYQRNDDFSGPKLANVWQWNHVPDDTKWSLSERPGYLRLHSLPAADFWWARNSLTQRAIGPESIATTELDASGLKPGDVAGLALLNSPFAWIGVMHDDSGYAVAEYSNITGKTEREPLTRPPSLAARPLTTSTPRCRSSATAPTAKPSSHSAPISSPSSSSGPSRACASLSSTTTPAARPAARPTSIRSPSTSLVHAASPSPSPSRNPSRSPTSAAATHSPSSTAPCKRSANPQKRPPSKSSTAVPGASRSKPKTANISP